MSPPHFVELKLFVNYFANQLIIGDNWKKWKMPKIRWCQILKREDMLVFFV